VPEARAYTFDFA